MRVEIQQLPASQIAAFHLQGAWKLTVPRGFARLGEWASRHRIYGEWLAVYYGIPEQVPPEQLEADTGISVPVGFVVPQDSEGVSLKTIPGGLYAVAQVQVTDGDFMRPWQDFFEGWLPGSGYLRGEGPSFERYLNDGTQSGVWDFLICIPVTKP